MAFRIPQRTWKTLSWLPVGIMFTQHCYTLKFVTGRSMQVLYSLHIRSSILLTPLVKPTLNPEPCIWRDLVVFDRLSVHLNQDIRRGDVVVLRCVWFSSISLELWLVSKHSLINCRSPIDPEKLLVKRIIALGGDVVRGVRYYVLKQ